MILLLLLHSILLSFHSDPTGQSDKNIFFINNNPAIINNNLIFGYKPNNFGINELNEVYFSGNYKIKNIILNGNVISNNNDINSEIKLSLGSIYKYDNMFNLGFRINYINNNIINYINENYINLDVGAILFFHEKVSVGGFFNNINISENNIISENNYFNFAFAYTNEKVSMFIGADLLFNIKYGINSGIKYNINDFISFRINYSALIKSVNAILNFNYNNISVNLFLTKHNQLGYSQNYQLIYDY